MPSRGISLIIGYVVTQNNANARASAVIVPEEYFRERYDWATTRSEGLVEFTLAS